MSRISFAPAATLSLEAMADLFTRSFEGYYYSAVITADMLAQRVRAEAVDLWRSPLLLVDGSPAGLAVVAMRGRRAWCGGFGIVAGQRGRGLALPLAQEMLRQAREGGAARFTLEVLTRNERAIRAYARAGLTPTRDLLVLEWRRPAEAPPAPAAPLAARSPEELLSHYGPLHPVAAAWQRDLASLLARGGAALGLAPEAAGPPGAYALCNEIAAGLRIVDLGARDAAAAEGLLRGLQARAGHLVTVNEPADSPLTAAFLAAGFTESDRQHELACDL